MKEQIHIVLITVGLFVAGLLAGVWTQRTRPIPPPPTPVLGEFRAVAPPGVDVSGFAAREGGFGFGFERYTPEHGAAIVRMGTRIAALEPQIKQFQDAVDNVEKNFLDRLDKVLTPQQRQKLAAMRAQEAPETIAAMPAPPPLPPPPPGEPGRFVVSMRAPFPVGGWLLMSMVIYQPSLDRLATELKLDPAQRATVKELMVQRRGELLTLIDTNPPPSLGFGDAIP
jgi:hypothetical protein